MPRHDNMGVLTHDSMGGDPSRPRARSAASDAHVGELSSRESSRLDDRLQDSREQSSSSTAAPERAATGANAQSSGAQPSVEREVLENVLRQPIGDHSVQSLALPAPFLERVSDRIIRESFVDRYRVVVDAAALDPKGASTESTTNASSATSPATESFPWIPIVGVVLLLLIGWAVWPKRKGTT